ncbi:MAG: hypothetical protein HN846_00700 [Candidatus Pacebacteria bacterium]|jgi:uncharacterized protein|nr:hypothetical protein [Candidatus Paceibacterota bacterium]MBT3511475.1 hypothetical protein [Candidatus Paceibacterota bacterium]MBT4004672.1 hypothetical protein [Candidatus Paceibacterota bacterium]MBT4358410.1 hypothetical protein [Candidatus Paceibacterota bacterium]MBT4680845.1 hypothetical protein [Candidatus Paceibacterota bacterium]
MKSALILHGTSDNPNKNWLPWLKTELEQRDYKTWVPQLPGADKPNIERYNDFIFSSDWKLDEQSVLIGHSSGAVAILGLLQALPTETKVDTCILVGVFKDTLGWDSLDGLFETPFDWDYIKTKAKRLIFIHSDDDSYCPLEHAQYISGKLDGELIIRSGQKHFSIGTAGEKYRQFLFLLELLSDQTQT